MARCQKCYNMEPYCTCDSENRPDQQPAPTGSESFDRAVIAMARRKGFDDVPDDAKVMVEMTGIWSGYSEYTITNQWDEFTIIIKRPGHANGDITFTYDTEEANRQWKGPEEDKQPKAAMAKLFEDLLA